MAYASPHDLDGGDFHEILTSATARYLLGHIKDVPPLVLYNWQDDWCSFIHDRIEYVLRNVPNAPSQLFVIGCNALHAFLQSNVTGPPLSWHPATVIVPQSLRDKLSPRTDLQAQMIASLSVDGEAVYKLIPHVELFCLAKYLLNHQKIGDEADTKRLRFRIRVNSWHQRLLSDVAPTLQEMIYRDLRLLEERLRGHDPQVQADFLVEQATIHTHHGFDKKARDDLAKAAKLRNFEYALTGRLGKRTKFQEKELSQLVLLARRADAGVSSTVADKNHLDRPLDHSNSKDSNQHSNPLDLLLNDDTLLESISFSKESDKESSQDEGSLQESLRDLDPADQPTLDPLDSIILLATASSITNTSPQDGLTREETLPYATRVLAGGSTNWQVYTQALIVRSRIEGYRSRTTERGLLQLQAIVDQVIAETTSDPELRPTDTGQGESEASATSFLPQPKPSESAPVSERLRYIHLLASPTRWKLESELADRWVSLGGLRSALEIYERLQMWAEVALCWAAQDRDDKAMSIIRGQLYVLPPSTDGETPGKDENDNFKTSEDLKELALLPNDAPRLFCILGDIEKSPSAYERAWEVSKHRYARAQRSLGKHYFAIKELEKADEAYSLSLKINPQNHGIWFALGCVRLQKEKWSAAVEAFARAVQIEEKDAESWSNLAAALLRLTPEESTQDPQPQNERIHEDDEDNNNIASTSTKPDPQKHTREAFIALKRAATLKRNSYRIWQNLLQVSIQLSPPPYTDIIIAQTRLIDLRGKPDGEKCIDIPVVEGLVAHLIATSPSPHIDKATRPGFEKMLLDLIHKRITPLITSSRRLWLLIAKLSLHLQHPAATLAAYEKAWRVALNQPGWDSGNKELWKEVAEATGELVDAYESLGERTREAGLGAGEAVARDWRFKARSAVRGVVGRAREGWDGSEEMEGLRKRGEELRGV